MGAAGGQCIVSRYGAGRVMPPGSGEAWDDAWGRP